MPDLSAKVFAALQERVQSSTTGGSGKAGEVGCQVLGHGRNLHLYYTSLLILHFGISVPLQYPLDFSSTATKYQIKPTILLNTSYIKIKLI